MGGRNRICTLRGLEMAVNRIVMHNGVVWWLPPLRPRTDTPGTDASAAEPTTPRPRKRPKSQDRPRRSAGPAAQPPAGFIPLSSLGIPGIDSILDSHADFYRDAYERAVRDERRRRRAAAEGDAAEDRTDEDLPGDAGRAAA